LTVVGATAQAPAGSTYTDSITLGNGTNNVTDTAAIAGNTVNITVGTGANTISVGGAATNTITLGAHSATVSDSVSVQAITGAAPATIVPTATVTGFNDNGADKIVFASDASAMGSVVTFSAAQMTSLLGSTAANLTSIVNAVLQNNVAANGPVIAQHGVGEFVYQGNTYVVEQGNAAGTAFSAGDTLVQLTGTHTLTSASAATSGTLFLHG
jgi:S-layer protein